MDLENMRHRFCTPLQGVGDTGTAGALDSISCSLVIIWPLFLHDVIEAFQRDCFIQKQALFSLSLLCKSNISKNNHNQVQQQESVKVENRS